MDGKDRIEKIMQKEEMNSAIFAAEIGIQGSTLSHILNGRNKPSLEVMIKILNRFRTVSSDWLILGIGTMVRGEKQSQAPTLFDSLEESAIKSDTLEPNLPIKNTTASIPIQQNSIPAREIPVQTVPEVASPPILPFIEQPTKSVRKIIVYYTDNTFQEFQS